MVILILQEPPACLLLSSCPDVALWAPEAGGGQLRAVSFDHPPGHNKALGTRFNGSVDV